MSYNKSNQYIDSHANIHRHFAENHYNQGFRVAKRYYHLSNGNPWSFVILSYLIVKSKRGYSPEYVLQFIKGVLSAKLALVG